MIFKGSVDHLRKREREEVDYLISLLELLRETIYTDIWKAEALRGDIKRFVNHVWWATEE